MMCMRSYGQLAVVPVCVELPVEPHDTKHEWGAQPMTSQLFAGHETTHVRAPVQSTWQLLAARQFTVHT